MQAILTKQCFPDYILRSDLANAGWNYTSLFSPQAWQQPLRTHKNPKWETEGKMSRTWWSSQPTLRPCRAAFGQELPTLSLLLSRQSPPGFFQDCLLGTPGYLFQTLQAPERARDSHPQSMWKLTGMHEPKPVQSNDSPHSKSPAVEALPNLASYFSPWSLGKECVSSRHRNAQPLACTFK